MFVPDSGFREVVTQIGKTKESYQAPALRERSQPVRLIATTIEGNTMPFGQWCRQWVARVVDGNEVLG
jgi:hypothetical protein